MAETARDYEWREHPRDQVHFRVRARRGETALTFTVVNLSPGGFMARSDDGLVPGDALRVALPGLGEVGAEVRWSLGGRIGCRLDRVVEPVLYQRLLATA